MELNTKEIEKAMNILLNQQIDSLRLRANRPYLLVPKSRRVLSDRYRKVGRPRKEDYDYVDFAIPLAPQNT